MLDQIRQPVQEHLDRFNALMRETMACDNTYINAITGHILAQPGKQMRPLLVLLAAGASGGVAPRTHVGAALVEMMHIASLVHDDVVDEAFLRRGQLSVNALWRSRVAVLYGDFLMSRAFSLTASHEAHDMGDEIIRALGELCKGELVQQEHLGKMDMTEEVYFNIIRSKTASLLAACGRIGALSAGAPAEVVQRMGQFGECIGMAFQVKDDMLDYDPAVDTGKPACADLRERKITLPLLALLARSGAIQRKTIIRQVADIRNVERNVERIRQQVLTSGAMEDARRTMEEFEQKAFEALGNCPSSPYTKPLHAYARYILEREK
ncbi:MAG: polyprenyl synthetase family protein [Rikenellaceae bacterium]|jgi:octaprenyl-diphosphate synthase|nr:polyprenyl synthetase family protein [Rikenellaceae bacterium]